MKELLTATLILLGLACKAFGGDLVPTDPKTPLFVVYDFHFDASPENAPPNTCRGEAGKPLLTVFSLYDLLVKTNDTGVKAVLNEKDTITFARLTHKHPFLLLRAADSSGVIMRIRGPIEDGVIPFDKANYSDGVARYLRHRYRIGHSSNSIEHSPEAL